MHNIVLRLFALCVLAHCAATDKGQFEAPPRGADAGYDTNEVWHLGETKTVKWTTSFTNYKILLWQKPLDGSVTYSDSTPVFSYSVLENNSSPTAFRP